MSGELSLRESELPTSERTYGDTGELLGIRERRADPELPSRTQDDGSEVHIRPAPGRSTTATTDMTVMSGVRSAQASLHNASSPIESSGSDSTERARGAPEIDREVSENTIGSNDAGDWETTRSESHPEFPPYPSRPSQDSYANTSTYSETNRLSAMSAAPGLVNPFREAAARTQPAASTPNTEDVEQARKAFKKIYKNKRVEESISNFVADFSSRTARPTSGGILQGVRERRPSAILEAREDDIELEEIRQRNPQAVRMAAEQFVAEQAAAESSIQRPRAMPLERLRSFFSRSNFYTAEQRENRAIMEDTIGGAEEDNRTLLAQTPSNEGQRSTLQYSETAATFRTVRGDSPTPWANTSRRGLDLGGRPINPAFPATAYSPENRRQQTLAHRSRIPARNPRRPTRQAAMSSQTSLRGLITSGSPTSNIQGAFTDREMLEASRRREMFPRRNYRQDGRNASSPFPRFPNTPLADPNIERAALIRPNDVLDPRIKVLQERLSKWYLLRMLPLPPLCFMYGVGQFDYLIARRTDGQIKEMSQSKKFDALCYGVLVGLLYCLMAVGIATAVMLVKR